MSERHAIQNPLLVLRLQERLGLRHGHVVPTLNPQLQGVIIVDDLRQSPVSSARGIINCAGAIEAVGDIGPPLLYGTVALHNPTGSGIIARVRRLIIAETGATAAVAVGLGLPPLAPLSTPNGFQLHSPPGVIGFPLDRSTCLIENSQQPVFIGGTGSSIVFYPNMATNTERQIDFPTPGVSLLPGGALSVMISSSSAELGCSFLWDEEPLASA